MSHSRRNPAVFPALRNLTNWIGGSFVDRRQHLHLRRRAVLLEWDRPVDGLAMVAEEILDLAITTVE